MAGIVVTTLQELKSAHKSRSRPTIVIGGELANNLLIAGMVRPRPDRLNGEGEIVQPRSISSQLAGVFEVLSELSRAHCFEILADSCKSEIKVYPRPSSRREGN